MVNSGFWAFCFFDRESRIGMQKGIEEKVVRHWKMVPNRLTNGQRKLK